MNPFTSAIVNELVEAGDLDKNIALLQKTYQSRLNVMDKALNEMLPSAGPEGVAGVYATLFCFL